MVCSMARHHWFSNARAARDLGYTPPVTLDRGLALTCDYFHRQVAILSDITICMCHLIITCMCVL
jgi:hypothetical protein